MKFSWQQYRYCPCCGTQYSPSNCDKETISLRCSICAYEFFQNSSPASTAVIPSKARRYEIILLTRATMPGKGLLGLPGGFLKYRESPYDAVRREAAEEVHVDIEVDRLLDSYLVDYEFRGTLVSVVELVFLSKAVDVDVQAIRTGEASAVGYYDVRAFRDTPSRMAFPEQHRALKRYEDYLGSEDHAFHH
jgi:ADP-ribose pyrophosphatase YjhB (NUDIX family)